MQANSENIISAGKGSRANLEAELITAPAHNTYLGSLFDQVEDPESSGAPIVAELANLRVDLDDYPEEELEEAEEETPAED